MFDKSIPQLKAEHGEHLTAGDVFEHAQELDASHHYARAILAAAAYLCALGNTAAEYIGSNSHSTIWRLIPYLTIQVKATIEIS